MYVFFAIAFYVLFRKKKKKENNTTFNGHLFRLVWRRARCQEALYRRSSSSSSSSSSPSRTSSSGGEQPPPGVYGRPFVRGRIYIYIRVYRETDGKKDRYFRQIYIRRVITVARFLLCTLFRRITKGRLNNNVIARPFPK